jgi:hypothetical protein
MLSKLFLFRNLAVRRNIALTAQKFLSFKHSTKSALFNQYSAKSFCTAQQQPSIKVIQTVSDHKVKSS